MSGDQIPFLPVVEWCPVRSPAVDFYTASVQSSGCHSGASAALL